jgi:threonine dehydrogenase-like Zn-dependent dehydrogenase
MMKVVKAFGPKDLRVVEAPASIPGNGDVLVAVRASGLCGSDKWYWNVEGPTEYIAGHEVAGEVVALGGFVTTLKIGDPVAINNVKGCGYCDECRAGRFVRCSNSITHMGHGFSEFVVAPERNCLLLDEKVSYEEGCLIFDNWGTPYGAIERAGISAGDQVVVSGCGPIGLGAVVLAKLFGARVIAIDPLKSRREAAIRLGADNALVPSENTAEEIKKLTGGSGTSTVFECSGKGQAYDMAFSALKIGGTLVSIGEGAKFEFCPSETLISKHLNMLGTLYSTMEQGRRVQELIVKGLIDPLCFVTHRFTLEELPKVFGRVFECSDGLLKTMVVIPDNSK